MNPERISRSESTAVDLLEKAVGAQLDELGVRLELPPEVLDREVPLATRRAAIWKCCKARGGTTLADLEEILRQQQGQPPPLYWLYMTCSEAERQDTFCRTFFNDVIRSLVGALPYGDLRYFDEGNRESPDVWSAWALRGIRDARVLVCLYTKSFFRSSYCGRVWGAFAERVQDYERLTGLRPDPSLIVPVLWGRPEENPEILPLAARQIGFDHNSFGHIYRRDGLRSLVQYAHARRGDWEREYNEFLTTFSRYVLRAAETHPLPPTQAIRPLDEMPSVFYSAPDGRRPVSKQQGAEYAKFVFIAARNTDDIGNLRRAEAYGSEPQHWRPYYPMSRERIGDLTHQAALEAGIEADTIPLDDRCLNSMRDATETQNILLVLVDPWTVLLRDYLVRAEEYNDADLPGSTMLVCWNVDDPDTTDFRNALDRKVQTAFANKFNANSPARIRHRIESIAQLRSELANALLGARRQIVDHTESVKPAEGAAFVRPASVPSLEDLGPSRQPDVRVAVDPATGTIAQPWVDGPVGTTRT